MASSNVVELDPRTLARERAREQTGAIGMVVALGAWGMMFAALLFSYLVLRAQAKAWPPPGLDIPRLLPAVNTVVMLVSSVTLHRALLRLRSGQRAQSVSWMAVTFALGLGFVALQLVLWSQLRDAGIVFSTGVVGSVLYALTMLHALHVVGGIVALGYLLVAALRGVQLQRKAAALRFSAMYWHFLDAVWFVMFVGMFVL